VFNVIFSGSVYLTKSLIEMRLAMKKNVIIIATILGFQCCIAQNGVYELKVKAYQDSMNHVQSNPKTTQIIEEEFDQFTGLHFFPISTAFVVNAILEESKTHETFKLTYSDDPDVPVYVIYGTVNFTLNGQEYKLGVYQNKKWLDDPVYKSHLFLPFKDWTNGPESYGGGRFMDLRIPDHGDKISLDFNLSYNPPCAYNYYMACPLIPDSNQINTEVSAGIMAY